MHHDSVKKFDKLVLAITTFNRKATLEMMLASYFQYRDEQFSWNVIIADDGSVDGTLPYLRALQSNYPELFIVENQRKGVHHQFNTLILELAKNPFDLCFKCDDDIIFLRAGWERLYIDAIQSSGYEHLCYYNLNWRKNKNLDPPIRSGLITASGLARDVQGAFFTVTPQMIAKVGFMDVPNFGFRGVGHIDYTLRACRLGFNDINHPFDATNSNQFIGLQTEQYKSALPEELVLGIENESDSERKYSIVDTHRTYIPCNQDSPTLDDESEKKYLSRAVKSLMHQKEWYEAEIRRLKKWQKDQYSHLPPWYIRIGKIFKLFRKWS